MILVGSRPWALILLVLCGACGGDSTGPQGVTGFYRLTHLRGVPVPYVDPLGCCVYESGSLELDQFDYTITSIARNKADTARFSVFESGSFTSPMIPFILPRKPGT